MKYRYLGSSGLEVSRICLGTMTFGNGQWGCDERAAREITRAFLEAGGTFFDTADVYSGGAAEQMLGEALKGFPREDLVVATKGFFRMGETPNRKGLSRAHLLSACEASLKRLGMEYVDLYQIHGPDPFTPIDETMRALEDLVRQGKVRYIGCSNLFAWQIVKANAAAQMALGSRFACGQYLYNLIVRDVEREILPACRAEGMGFICWSPLGAGMLSGKYPRAEKPREGSRIQQSSVHEVPRYWHERGFAIVEELAKTSGQLGVPPAQAALAWLLHDRRVSSIIVGTRTPAQLREDLAVGDWDLPQEAWQRLEKASRFDHGYPKQWMDIVVPATFNDAE
jgi:aryl-alcohol dehydrogenase-like predicted oxidoreductase